MTTTNDLKPGDVVRATCVITDADDGRTYIHAVPGTFGTVLPDDFKPEWPVIDWFSPFGSGTCNADPSMFERYAGRVVCVVDPAANNGG